MLAKGSCGRPRAVIADLRRLLKEGRRPPDARTGELVKMPAASGMYWRYPGFQARPLVMDARLPLLLTW